MWSYLRLRRDDVYVYTCMRAWSMVAVWLSADSVSEEWWRCCGGIGWWKGQWVDHMVPLVGDLTSVEGIVSESVIDYSVSVQGFSKVGGWQGTVFVWGFVSWMRIIELWISSDGVIIRPIGIALHYQLTDEMICLTVILSAVKGLLMEKSGQKELRGSSKDRRIPRSYNWYTSNT